MTTPLSKLGAGGAGLSGGDNTLRALLQSMVIAVDLVNPPLGVDNQIVASVAGNSAGTALTVAANPDIPRNLVATFGATYDAGDLTVKGVDQFGHPATEVLASNAGGTTTGSVAWRAITSVTRAVHGTTTGTVKVGTGAKLGIGFKVKNSVHLFTCDGVAEAATLDATNGTVTSTTAYNGAHDYKLLVSPA